MKGKFLLLIFCLIMSFCLLLIEGCNQSVNNDVDKDMKVRVNDDYVQLSSDGSIWTNLISIDDIKDKWSTDLKGKNGDDGKEVELQVDNNEIQWRYVGGEWQSLIPLSEIKGSNGTNGTNGINGTDGATWLTGTTAPQNSLGINGDLYLNTTTNDIYKKSNNTWAIVCNIKGENCISITSVSYIQTVDNVDKYRIDFSEGEPFIFEIMNGIDATYSTYKVTLDYGTHPKWFTSSTTTEITIKSTEWLSGLPDVNSRYITNFLGWYIKGTDKQIENYDFIGGDITLEAKYLEPGLYQNGVLVKSWEQLQTEYPKAISGSMILSHTISSTNVQSYFTSLYGEFVISPDITFLYLHSFDNCVGLTSIVIPNSVTTISEWTFDNCIGLTSLDFPASVTSFPHSSFENCSNLKHISIDKNNTKYKTDGKAIFSIDGKEMIAYVASGATETYSIPEGVTTINGNAFTGTTDYLKTITLPSTLTKIDAWAFANGLFTTINMPSTLTEIDTCAFLGCENLKSITIPSSVTKIGKNAFQSCDSLKNAYFDDVHTWYYTTNQDYTGGSELTIVLSGPYANYLTNTYRDYYLYKI